MYINRKDTMEKADWRKLNPANESSPADASWFVVSSPNAWGSQTPWRKNKKQLRGISLGWLLIGKLWSEAASSISSSISTIYLADSSLPKIPSELRYVGMIFESFVAQDMASGRLCIRSDQGLISEDKEKCVSGTCRILFAKSQGSGNDANVSALTKER